MIQTIASEASRQTQYQPAPAHELSQLTANGILIGVPRAISIEQHREFPLIEVNLRIESLRAIAVAQFMETHNHIHVIWRIVIDKFHLKDPFVSKEWQIFLALFNEKHCMAHTLILSYDWEVEFSYMLLEQIHNLKKTSGIMIYVDAEHYSWKAPKVQETMLSLRLPQVFHDAPCLPGLIKNVGYHVGSVAILRCIGRNRKSWFEPNVDERYAYTYLHEELHEIAKRSLILKEDHKEVLILFCNRPASSTINSALLLAHMLQ
jgi:hypothetical protein